MFEIKGIKSFKDSVHGYINIPMTFVKNIVDTDYFQRLRNIDQTGMRVLYPDAKHDRFGHSLGVFHLGCKAVDALLRNFSTSKYWNISSGKDNTSIWAKNKILFLIACLLHDIGHVPFSHALENEFNPIDVKRAVFSKIHKMEMQDESLNIATEKQIAAHELLGALLVLDKLADNIKCIIDDLRENNFPKVNNNGILYAEHYQNNKTIAEFQADDLCFIARMIIGWKYDDFRPEKQIRNCFIELLNGTGFDVDNLDYILRDTQMSGINNFSIDVERLLGAINIVHTIVYDNSEHISLQKVTEMNQITNNELSVDLCNNVNREIKGKTITLLEFKRGKLIIKGCLNGCFSIPQGYTVTIKKGSTFECLSSEKHYMKPVKIQLTNHINALFDENTDLYIGAKRILAYPIIQGYFCKTLPTQNNDENIECQISHAKLNGDFVFNVYKEAINRSSKREEKNGKMHTIDFPKAYLTIKGYCEMIVELSGVDNTPIDPIQVEDTLMVLDGTIDGDISKLKILNDDIDEVANEKKYISFAIGYHKQAMSIITNVLEARNYLYLWIYAHHKVVYYANFLLPSVSVGLLNKGVFDCTCVDKAFFKELNYKDILCLDDSYFWTLIRQYGINIDIARQKNCLELLCCRQCNGIDFENDMEREVYLSDLKRLSNQLINRQYFNSLFKSFAEYDLMFTLYNNSQKANILINLQQQIDEKRPHVHNLESISAGFLKSDVVEQVNNKLQTSKIKSMVFVKAEYKQKKLRQSNVYIVIRDEVVSMDQIPSICNKDASYNESNSYFYIYYDVDNQLGEQNLDELKLEKQEIKKAFSEYFDSIKNTVVVREEIKKECE